jgi:hypothetical protein
MSAIGMFGTGVLESLLSRTTQSSFQSFKQNFQQLGKDLQAGNTAQAQADLAALQPSASSNNPATASSTGLVSQSFNQIAQDLQSGNLSAAESDYATLQQNLQQANHRDYRHHSHGATSSATTQTQQALTQLGQALQSGSLSSAQQAYSSLQTELSAFNSSTVLGGSGQSSSSGVNLSA